MSADRLILFPTLELFLNADHLFHNRDVFIMEPFVQSVHKKLCENNNYTFIEYKKNFKQWIFRSFLTKSSILMREIEHYGKFKVSKWNSIVLDSPNQYDPSVIQYLTGIKLLYVTERFISHPESINHPLISNFEKFALIKSHPSGKFFHIFEAEDWYSVYDFEKTKVSDMIQHGLNFDFSKSKPDPLTFAQTKVIGLIGDDLFFKFLQKPSDHLFDELLTYLYRLGNIHFLIENVLFRLLSWLWKQSSQNFLREVNTKQMNEIKKHVKRLLNHSVINKLPHFKEQISFLYSSQFDIMKKSDGNTVKNHKIFYDFLLDQAKVHQLLSKDEFCSKLIDLKIVTIFDSILMGVTTDFLNFYHFCYLLSTEQGFPTEFFVPEDIEAEREIVKKWRYQPDPSRSLEMINHLIDPSTNLIFHRNPIYHKYSFPRVSFLCLYAIHCVIFWANNMNTPEQHPSLFKNGPKLKNTAIRYIDMNSLFTWKDSSRKRKRFD